MQILLTVKLREIKNKSEIWSIKMLSIAAKNLWQTDFEYFDNEINAEYKLSIIKSKRMEDVVDLMSEVDLGLDWGQERTFSVTDPEVTFIKKTGDFSPWFKGECTVNEIIDAFESLYEFCDNTSPKEEVVIAFIHYFTEVKKIFTQQTPDSELSNYEQIELGNILHPSIKMLAKNRMSSGAFADAVESVFKHVNTVVKNKVIKDTGVEYDGSDLMQRAFSVKNPLISLDDLTYESGRNIQAGYMQIFSGSMTGIRNPKAHANIEIDNKRALHFLCLASLLMCKLEEAGVRDSGLDKIPK